LFVVLHHTPIEFRAAASPALLERGSVNVISLSAIRQEAGGRWTRIRDGVYARLEFLLRQKLGATDFFARLGEEAYLVTMPSTDPEDVNVVCLRVAYDLYNSFLGQCSASDLIICNASSGGENMLLLAPLPAERIVTLADKAGIRELTMAKDGHAPPTHAGEGGGNKSAVGAVEATPGTRKTSSLTVHYQYAPVWSVPNNAITTYVCEPKTIRTTAAPHKLLSLAQLGPRERIEVELSCLAEGVMQLARHARQGERFLLGVMVSFEALGSPAGRMEFLSTCRALASEHRQYLDFTLTGVPQGVAQTRLNNLVNTLRPFGRTMSATAAPGTRDYAPYQGLGLRAIGLHTDECPNGLRKGDAMQLARAAKVLKLGTFLYGVNQLNMLKIAHAAEIQQLAGPAIAPPSEEPHKMSRLTWGQVLSEKYVGV
jgi:hypothetical protein